MAWQVSALSQSGSDETRLRFVLRMLFSGCVGELPTYIRSQEQSDAVTARNADFSAIDGRGQYANP
jgi:hypothetical protein